MGVYKRKVKAGIRWRYVGQHLGVSYCSKSIYHTRGEALRAERDKIFEIDENIRNPNQDMRLFDLMEERLDELKLKKSQKYYIESKRYFKMLYHHVGDVNVSDVTKPQINKLLQDFSKELKKRGKTDHKVNAMLRILKALFNYGIKVYDLEIRNPCKGLDFYSVDKKFKWIPTDFEIEQIKELCDKEECILIDFVKETGARINEALRITPSDVFEDFVILHTRKSRNSNLVPRKVPRPACLDNFSGLKKTERIFKRWVAQPRFLEKYIRKIGQEMWGWHSLRHRFASKLSRENKPIYEIMSLLGHSNMSTTQNYLQLLP